MGGIMGSPTNHIPSEIRTPCLTDSTTSRYQKSAERRPIVFQWFFKSPKTCKRHMPSNKDST